MSQLVVVPPFVRQWVLERVLVRGNSLLHDLGGLETLTTLQRLTLKDNNPTLCLGPIMASGAHFEKLIMGNVVLFIFVVHSNS